MVLVYSPLSDEPLLGDCYESVLRKHIRANEVFGLCVGGLYAKKTKQKSVLAPLSASFLPVEYYSHLLQVARLNEVIYYFQLHFTDLYIF